MVSGTVTVLMKAVVCQAWGPVETLRYEEFPAPQLRNGQVRIAVHAAGLNFSDALKVQGLHQVNVPPPFVPGSETAGVIVDVGPDVPEERVGQRVIGVGTKLGGGYADEVVLDAHRAVQMPASMSFAEGAAFPSVYGTAMHALVQRGRLQTGETLLVLGAAGGAGLAAVQLGSVMGARVIAAASTPAKRALAKSQGAHETVDYTAQRLRDAVNDLTDGHGADLIYDPVGGDAFDEATHCIGWAGRLMIVGFASGQIPTLRMNLPLLKGFEVTGVRYDVWRDDHWHEALSNFETMFGWCDEGRLRPHVGNVYPISEAVSALELMMSRGATGKTVLLTDRESSSAAR
jgi:NADPH2:quinone reductase